MAERPLVRVSEVAQRLDVPPRAIYRLVARGEIAAVRVGVRGLRFAPQAIDDYVRTHGCGCTGQAA